MEGFKIRKMEEADVCEVLEIENEHIGKTNKQTILDTLANDVLSYYVLEKDNHVIGFYELSIISPEAELFDIAVSKNFQGKGFGKILMQSVIETCKQSAINTIFLEVNSINKKAICLYEQFGFKPYAERKNYYGENLNAILMKKQM